MTAQRKRYQRMLDIINRLPGEWAPDKGDQIIELLSIADRLNHYNETECNYGLTECQQKLVERLEERARVLTAALGVGIKFNGDPRGFAVKLMLPSGDFNTWGGKEEGWGI